MKFDDDVPMPLNTTRYVWDFGAMQVGQSLFVPEGTPENRWAPDRARAAMKMANWRYRGARHWEWRSVDGGIRIWRTL